MMKYPRILTVEAFLCVALAIWAVTWVTTEFYPRQTAPSAVPSAIIVGAMAVNFSWIQTKYNLAKEGVYTPFIDKLIAAFAGAITFPYTVVMVAEYAATQTGAIRELAMLFPLAIVASVLLFLLPGRVTVILMDRAAACSDRAFAPLRKRFGRERDEESSEAAA